MSNLHSYYTIPTAIDKSVASVIEQQMKTVPLDTASVLGDEDERSDVMSLRNSKIHWIASDHWVAGMMAHFINVANIGCFHFDLNLWSEKIQYTVYDEVGANYGWHVDSMNSPHYHGLVRKLSMSLCLSDSSEYEGGELELVTDNDNFRKHTFKMNCGDAIIFPSTMRHRVKPITAGKRVSLVGWYAGPPLR